MRALLAGAGCLAVGVALLVGGITHRAGDSHPTSTHVAAVLLDGINHGDARQVCSVIRREKGETMPACEASWSNTLAQLSFYGVWGSYRIVAHSAREWTETYNGREVRVARVSAYSTTSRGTLLHVRMVWVEGRGWLVAAVT